MTLRDHAAEWARENYIPVPPFGTPQWRAVYLLWHAYAFAGF